MIKTIIFDMDGVIFDTERMMAKSSLQVCKEMNIVDGEKFVQDNAGINGSRIKVVAGNILGSKTKGKRFYRRFAYLYVKDVLLHGTPLKEGIAELLAYLQDNGYTMAVASTSKTFVVKLLLKRAGLIGYFRQVIGGDKIENKKPAPDIYLKSIKELGITCEECYAVEDSIVGARASIDANIKTIIIPDLQQPDEYNKQYAYKIFKNGVELLAYLKEQD